MSDQAETVRGATSRGPADFPVVIRRDIWAAVNLGPIGVPDGYAVLHVPSGIGIGGGGHARILCLHHAFDLACDLGTSWSDYRRDAQFGDDSVGSEELLWWCVAWWERHPSCGEHNA